MRVRIDPTTHEVVVEGVDITALVRRVTVDAHVGRQPEVFLELSQSVLPEVLEHDAVVHVVRDAEVNPAEIIKAWLDGIDPGVLERAVLDGDISMSQSTGQVFLDVLRGWVTGG